ncbi:MAG: ester cyclase [Balneolales bacterium]
MTPHETFRKGLEAINNHDARAFAAVYAEGAIIHDPQYTERLRGREAIERDMANFLITFPDFRAEERTFFASENRYAAECTCTGTHEGELNNPDGDNIPATGKQVMMDMALFAQVNDLGELVEEHRYYDIATMLKQMGIGTLKGAAM